MPSDYEFMSLLDAITMVESGESGLSEQSRTLLKDLQDPLTVQVFVTPT